MEIKIKLDDAEMLEQLRAMSPERFMRAWAIAVKNLARKKAQEAAAKSGGRSFWQREILPSIHEKVDQFSAEIYSDSYIAEHVHTGGVIKPRTRKYLAIPVDKSVRGKSPDEYSGLVFLRRKDEGPNGRAYLAKPMKTKVKPLWVLKRSVMQRPRPWWPDDAEVSSESLRFFREDF